MYGPLKLYVLSPDFVLYYVLWLVRLVRELAGTGMVRLWMRPLLCIPNARQKGSSWRSSKHYEVPTVNYISLDYDTPILA
jgi:hypothetical protein